MEDICNKMNEVSLLDNTIQYVIENDFRELVKIYNKMVKNNGDTETLIFQANTEIDMHIDNSMMKGVYEYLVHENRGYDLLTDIILTTFPGTYVELDIVDGIIDNYLNLIHMSIIG